MQHNVTMAPEQALNADTEGSALGVAEGRGVFLSVGGAGGTLPASQARASDGQANKASVCSVLSVLPLERKK